MPVNIVENWTEIKGEVLRVIRRRETPKSLAVTIKLHNVKPVAGFANLIDRQAGETLEALFPIEIVDQMKFEVGDVLSCRVRKAGLERYYVHREHVSVHS
jgi:hypothetical protein